MISRIADHCFWLGRYLERADSTARLLTTTRDLAFDSELSASQCWHPVIVVSGEEAQFRARFAPTDDAEAWEDGDLIEKFMTWDADNGTSILASVRGARWNARQMRETVSIDVWKVLNELHLWLADPDTETSWNAGREGMYGEVRSRVQLCLAESVATMLHDEPLDFIWLGAMLERASQTARILDVHYHAFSSIEKLHVAVETGLWLSLLRALSGFEPFMKRYRGRVESALVARFLVSEDRFPRSVGFATHAAYERLCRIRPPEATELPGGGALKTLRLLDERLKQVHADPASIDQLHDLLTDVVNQVHQVGALLNQELLGYGESISEHPPAAAS